MDETIKESDADDNNEELQIRINDDDIEALPVEDKAKQEVCCIMIIKISMTTIIRYLLVL